jgi:hypothetical protein
MPFLQYRRGPFTFGKNIFKFPPSDETFGQARSVIVQSVDVPLGGAGDATARRLVPGTIMVWKDPAHQYVRPYVGGDDPLDATKVAGISYFDEDFTLADGPIGVMWRNTVFLSAAIVGLTGGNLTAVRASFPTCAFE